MKFVYRQPVMFRAAMSGGYGYSGRDIPAQFLRYTFKRAVIRVWTADKTTFKDIAVHPYNLTAVFENGNQASMEPASSLRSEAPK